MKSIISNSDPCRSGVQAVVASIAAVKASCNFISAMLTADRNVRNGS
jgi:hypothetical protein